MLFQAILKKIQDHAKHCCSVALIKFIRPWKIICLPWLYRLYYPLRVLRRIDTCQIVYLSNKDPCPKM